MIRVFSFFPLPTRRRWVLRHDFFMLVTLPTLFLEQERHDLALFPLSLLPLPTKSVRTMAFGPLLFLLLPFPPRNSPDCFLLLVPPNGGPELFLLLFFFLRESDFYFRFFPLPSSCRYFCIVFFFGSFDATLRSFFSFLSLPHQLRDEWVEEALIAFSPLFFSRRVMDALSYSFFSISALFFLPPFSASCENPFPPPLRDKTPAIPKLSPSARGIQTILPFFPLSHARRCRIPFSFLFSQGNGCSKVLFSSETRRGPPFFFPWFIFRRKELCFAPFSLSSPFPLRFFDDDQIPKNSSSLTRAIS